MHNYILQSDLSPTKGSYDKQVAFAIENALNDMQTEFIEIIFALPSYSKSAMTFQLERFMTTCLTPWETFLSGEQCYGLRNFPSLFSQEH